MKTTKTYVRKVYTGHAHAFENGPPGTRTFVYLFPEELVQLALDHGTQQDEGYELVTETVSGISSARLDTLITVGLMRHRVAREAADRAADEAEYERLRKKLRKS
jgi:pyrroline-5-carboxylate reductase